MRKFLLGLVCILALGTFAAVAQNITKGLQLSQDPTGSFGVDTNNNVYFPAHILTAPTNGAPIVAAALGTATIVGSDVAGTVTGAVGVTTATVTFRQAYLSTPSCLVASQNPATSPIAYNLATTGINITTSFGSAIINYVCAGSR